MSSDSMTNPGIETLLSKVRSKFELVTLSARRARQINDYSNQLGGGLGGSIPPQVSSTARKPLSIAFEEIAADKIIRVDPPEPTPEPSEEELAAIEADPEAAIAEVPKEDL